VLGNAYTGPRAVVKKCTLVSVVPTQLSSRHGSRRYTDIMEVLYIAYHCGVDRRGRQSLSAAHPQQLRNIQSNIFRVHVLFRDMPTSRSTWPSRRGPAAGHRQAEPWRTPNHRPRPLVAASGQLIIGLGVVWTAAPMTWLSAWFDEVSWTVVWSPPWFCPPVSCSRPTSPGPCGRLIRPSGQLSRGSVWTAAPMTWLSVGTERLLAAESRGGPAARHGWAEPWLSPHTHSTPLIEPSGQLSHWSAAVRWVR
jgi:hypothetical protein